MFINKIKKTLTTLPPFKKVIVGVSGGADSVALACILRELGYDVIIAHLNHSLRGKESDGDEKFVKNLAQKWKTPFVTCKIKIPKNGNLEDTARKIRYQFLEKVRQAQKAEFIAVAHHADDQIETILMHIKRGAGLRGMCGMRLRSDKIIRPLLNVKKADLINYLDVQKLAYRTDKTNFDLNFERNFIRHVVIPELQKKDRNFEKKLLSLSLLAQKKLYKIEKTAKNWIRKNVINQTFDATAFRGLPDDEQSEVILELVGHQDIYSKHIQEVKELIRKGSSGKQKKIGNFIFSVQYEKIIFLYCRDVPWHVSKPKKQKLSKKTIKWGNYKISYIGNDVIYVRQWQPGDKFQPMGMRGTKKLQDFFVDQKIPKNEREYIPIIVDEKNQILAVGDMRFSDRGRALTKLIKISRV